MCAESRRGKKKVESIDVKKREGKRIKEREKKRKRKRGAMYIRLWKDEEAKKERELST